MHNPPLERTAAAVYFICGWTSRVRRRGRSTALRDPAMEVIEYPRSLQWVGDLMCPRCERLTPAWRSSGMSDSCPHFYCDRCSNVILREADQWLAYGNESREVLDMIAATLPECPCGGRFRPGANPKCRYCGSEMPNSW